MVDKLIDEEAVVIFQARQHTGSLHPHRLIEKRDDQNGNTGRNQQISKPQSNPGWPQGRCGVSWWRGYKIWPLDRRGLEICCLRKWFHLSQFTRCGTALLAAEPSCGTHDPRAVRLFDRTRLIGGRHEVRRRVSAPIGQILFLKNE